MLIGRDTDVALITARLQEGRPFAVLGEAGVGKTTLIRASAEELGKPLVEAGALATLAWLPYLPLRRAFGRDFAEGDAAYVAAQIESAVGDAVLFVDDLHWADNQTRALLPLLAHRVATATAIRRGDPGTTGALEALASAGFELIPLEPLEKTDADQLARALHPDLSEHAADRLVARSGGNPFLLEQLAATGEPSTSLKLALAARLRNLGAAGRDAMASLALLGRPAEARLLGPGISEVVAAGLAQGDGTVAIRHALLAEATIDMLDQADKRRLHSRLAAALTDPGEAARHHAAAGEGTEAHAKALRAAGSATTPGERAAHLAIAAASATGDKANALRMEAAVALIEAGAPGDAAPLLEAISSSDPDVLARCAYVRAIVLGEEVDARGARDSIMSALALARDPDLVLQARVREARMSVFLELEPGEEALAKARRVLADTQAAGRYEAEAHYVVGTAAAEVGLITGDWEDHLREAVRRSRAEGLHDVEFRAALNRACYLKQSGKPVEAIDIVREQIERARELRLLGWERNARADLTCYGCRSGHYRQTVEEGERLLSEPISAWLRFMIAAYVASALTDLGEFTKARAMLDPALEPGVNDATHREALWALAELEYWAGRPTQAIAAADAFLESHSAHWPVSWVESTRAWARFDAGIPQGGHQLGPTARYGASPTEQHALELLSDGRWAEAASKFDAAADLWRAHDFRGEMRARWGAAEALRLGGNLVEARARLHDIEKVAIARGMRPLLARVRRSLRLAGEARATKRTHEGRLTGREREVLSFVAEGLTNDEIAGRLGVGRPTVVRLIGNAQDKLGATSRAQAAALAART